MVKIKTSFGRPPAKGTKLREITLLLLRGVHPRELRARGLHRQAHGEVLVEQKGYDLYKFPNGESMIIGKMKWDGGY